MLLPELELPPEAGGLLPLAPPPALPPLLELDPEPALLFPELELDDDAPFLFCTKLVRSKSYSDVTYANDLRPTENP